MASFTFKLNRSFPKVNLKGIEPSSNTIVQYKNDSFRFVHWAEDEFGGTKKSDKRKDTQKEKSPRLYDFATHVGIRRNEYLRLRKNCLMRDESGYLCVFVKKGKGGKKQWQRIFPQFEAAVLAYFDGTDDFVFSKQEMKNTIDLHAIRAQVAKDAYELYLNLLLTNPDYRLQLEQELQARWEACGKVWDVRNVRGTYTVRKGNRDLASRHNRPIHYDRLALMAVSTFHLSHWRCGVAVANYLLALGD